MDEIKKNFGFGCMRLPMKDGEVDIPQTKQMVDTFLDNGFNDYTEKTNFQRYRIPYKVLLRYHIYNIWYASSIDFRFFRGII